MTWLLCESEYIDDGISFGFVYMIENKITGRKYIGRKYFTQAGYKQVNGKRKKIRKPYDWKTYYGSNATLQEDVSILGEDKFGGRVLGDILLDGQSLRAMLIQNGFAREYFGEAKQSWCN